MNMYDSCDTMKMLGNQFYTAALGDNINEVIGVYKEWGRLGDIKSLCADIYNLGFINGIRDERSRRRRKDEQ